MRKQCKRKRVERKIHPLVFKPCESARGKQNELDARIAALYLCMQDGTFKDNDFGVLIEFICLANVIASVACNDEFEQYIDETQKIIYRPYVDRMIDGKWSFTEEECERLRLRLFALADALADLPYVTIQIALKESNMKANKFLAEFKERASLSSPRH